MLKIGISGAGSIGLRHAELLAQRKNLELIICDPVPSSLDAAKSMIVHAKFTASFNEMLDSGINGLVIAAPDKFHIEQLEAACVKGIPTLVEKPLAENYEQAKVCLEKLGKCAEKVLVGYPLQFCSVMQQIKTCIDTGLIGTPLSFQAMLGAYETLVVAKNRFSDTESNKLFVDYSHEWNYTSWLLGDYESVVAAKHKSGNLEFYQNPNIVDSLVRLRNGITGTVHLDYVQSPGDRSITIIGDKGTLKSDIANGTIIIKTKADDFVKHYDCSEHRNKMFIREHDNFIAMINEDAKPLVSIEDGIQSLAIAEAMIKSAETRQWQNVHPFA